MSDIPLYDPDDTDIDYETAAEMPPGEAEALERASWHMRMAARLTAEKDQLTAVYQAEMDRLTERIQHRRRILDQRIAWHEEPVKALHLNIVARNPKRKTIDLPYGTSKVRVPATPRVVITDKPALLAWAENTHPDLLSRDINVTAVKTIAQATRSGPLDPNGEVIPGVEFVLDAPSWSSNYDTEVTE